MKTTANTTMRLHSVCVRNSMRPTGAFVVLHVVCTHFGQRPQLYHISVLVTVCCIREYRHSRTNCTLVNLRTNNIQHHPSLRYLYFPLLGTFHLGPLHGTDSVRCICACPCRISFLKRAIATHTGFRALGQRICTRTSSRRLLLLNCIDLSSALARVTQPTVQAIFVLLGDATMSFTISAMIPMTEWSIIISMASVARVVRPTLHCWERCTVALNRTFASSHNSIPHILERSSLKTVNAILLVLYRGSANNGRATFAKCLIGGGGRFFA
jgi:hypothetical protein